MKADKVPVSCPVCGHVQPEPPTAYSTVCKQCRRHFRVQEVLHPTAPPKPPPRETKQISCFACGRLLTVAVSAQSTNCKHCGSYVDLQDYCIAKPIGKNYRTKGRLLIEKEGFLYNTDTIAGDVVIKGRLLGRITAERSLEMHTSAEIRGSFRTSRLVVPAGQWFRWPDTIQVDSAEIAGELVADLSAAGSVLLRSTARYFGQLQAKDCGVESGAVFVGSARVGCVRAEAVGSPAL